MIKIVRYAMIKRTMNINLYVPNSIKDVIITLLVVLILFTGSVAVDFHYNQVDFVKCFAAKYWERDNRKPLGFEKSCTTHISLLIYVMEAYPRPIRRLLANGFN
jgi:hypothetical protein